MRGLKIYYKILAFITAVFMLVYPFISYMHVAKPKGMELEYFAKKSKVILDFFYYYKEFILFVFALFMVIAAILWLVLYWIVREKKPEGLLRDKRLFVALGGYFLLNLISVVCSEYREYGLMGLSIDYEGLAAVFGYMVLFSLGYFLFREEKTVRFLLIMIRLLAIVLIAGTFLEMYTGSFVNSGWFRDIFSSEKYSHLLEYRYWQESGSISLTFGNSGFFGGFCAMLLPVILGSALVEDRKCFVAADCILSGGLFFCIMMSESAGALYGAAMAVTLELFFLIFSKKSGWKKMLCIITGCLLAGLLFLAVAEGVFGKDENLGEQIKDTVVNEQYEVKENVFRVKRIYLQEGKLVTDGEKASFTVEAVGDGTEMKLSDFSFSDGEGNPLMTGQETKENLSGDFKNICVEVKGRILSVDFGYKDPVELYAKEGKLYYIDFNGSLLAEIPQPKMMVFRSIYPLFTGRGYIWASSIPMLADSLLIGKGIGTFPFYYPQSEVEGMLNVHGSADYCIEQAHSWYLQTMQSSGGISLICMLYVIFAVLGKGLRQSIRSKDLKRCRERGLLLLWGLLAFAVTGIVNNSCVAATPVFWLFLGVLASGNTKSGI